MQPMWLCILKGRPFEETHESTHWRKVEQMQLMWLCFLSGKQFEDTHENAQWRKVKQMQPMWLCILSGRQFEETHDNAQWEKSNKCNLCILSGRPYEGHIWKRTKGISQTNATNVVFYFQKSRYRYLSPIPVYRRGLPVRQGPHLSIRIVIWILPSDKIPHHSIPDGLRQLSHYSWIGRRQCYLLPVRQVRKQARQETANCDNK